MKFIFTLIALTFSIVSIAQRCGTVEYSNQVNHTISFTSSTAITDGGTRDTLPNEVIVVPVVFHILYHSNDQNISDQQVLSQLTVLNNDYRRLNADTIYTPTAFKSVAADARIIFCIAKVDPNGRYTTGIVHKYTSQDLFLSDDGMKFSSSGGDDAWDSKKYLNIWVCNLFGRTLGYGVMPGGPAERDGVVMQFTAFGTIGTAQAPYNKGRTATHEIGHWLGLRHPWGDADCGNDSIADTPTQETSNSGCPSFPHLSTCSPNANGDMFMDFMDFTDDACMNMFSKGQVNEMRGLFASGNLRNSILNSAMCDSSLAQGGPLPDSISNTNPVTISVYPNPFSKQFTIKSSGETAINSGTIKVYDVTGKLFLQQTITSASSAISVNLVNVPDGMYFLKIETPAFSKVFKLVKNNNALQ